MTEQSHGAVYGRRTGHSEILGAGFRLARDVEKEFRRPMTPALQGWPVEPVSRDTQRGAGVDSCAGAETDVAAAAEPPPASAPDARDDLDRSLVARAVAGDRKAFEALLRRHLDRIHRLAWRLTGSSVEADEIRQEVCCVLVEKIGMFKGEAKFTTWLSGIVINKAHDHGRRRRSRTGLLTRFALWSDASVGQGADLHDRIWLESFLSRLKPAYRDAVVLVAGEGLSHAEAAVALGVAESTISWRMHEVRRLLADKTS